MVSRSTLRSLFPQVLIVLGTMLRVGNLINVVAHHVVERLLLHGTSEIVQLLLGDVHLAALEERVVDLLLLLLRLGIDADAVEVF